MSWSWRIGRIAGIGIYLHFTFLLLLAYLLFAHYAEHQDLGEAVKGLTFIIALFAIVVAHELGHALAARHYGIETRDITLLPIGGVARLDRIPEQPMQELVVALAGPAVNIVLAVALYLGIRLDQRLGVFEVSEAARVGGDLVHQLFLVNVFLAGFNLLPAFPMDGGRVLRALLAMRMDYVRATQLAATIGQFMAILFAVAGLFDSNPFLFLIALFVWMGAGQEAAFVQLRRALAGIPVQRVMATQFETLRPDETIAAASRSVLAGFQQDFPVVNDEGQVIGVLTRRDLAEALAANDPSVLVRDKMQQEFFSVHPRDMLYAAFTRLQECQCQTLPVIDDQNRLIGLLTANAVAEVLTIHQSAKTAKE